MSHHDGASIFYEALLDSLLSSHVLEHAARLAVLLRPAPTSVFGKGRRPSVARLASGHPEPSTVQVETEGLNGTIQDLTGFISTTVLPLQSFLDTFAGPLLQRSPASLPSLPPASAPSQPSATQAAADAELSKGISPATLPLLRSARALLSQPCVQYWLGWALANAHLTLTAGAAGARGLPPYMRLVGGGAGGSAASGDGGGGGSSSSTGEKPTRGRRAAPLSTASPSTAQTQCPMSNATICRLLHLASTAWLLQLPSLRTRRRTRPAAAQQHPSPLQPSQPSCGPALPYRRADVYGLVYDVLSCLVSVVERGCVDGAGGSSGASPDDKPQPLFTYTRPCAVVLWLLVGLLGAMRHRAAAAHLPGLWRLLVRLLGAEARGGACRLVAAEFGVMGQLLAWQGGRGGAQAEVQASLQGQQQVPVQPPQPPRPSAEAVEPTAAAGLAAAVEFTAAAGLAAAVGPTAAAGLAAAAVAGSPPAQQGAHAHGWACADTVRGGAAGPSSCTPVGSAGTSTSAASASRDATMTTCSTSNACNNTVTLQCSPGPGAGDAGGSTSTPAASPPYSSGDSLSAALDAGLVGALDTLLRAAGREQGCGKGQPSAPALRRAGAAVEELLLRPGAWPALLAHGSAGQVASLILTLRKLALLAGRLGHVRLHRPGSWQAEALTGAWEGDSQGSECSDGDEQDDSSDEEEDDEEDDKEATVKAGPADPVWGAYLAALLEQAAAVLLPPLQPPADPEPRPVWPQPGAAAAAPAAEPAAALSLSPEDASLSARGDAAAAAAVGLSAGQGGSAVRGGAGGAQLHALQSSAAAPGTAVPAGPQDPTAAGDPMPPLTPTGAFDPPSGDADMSPAPPHGNAAAAAAAGPFPGAAAAAGALPLTHCLLLLGHRAAAKRRPRRMITDRFSPSGVGVAGPAATAPQVTLHPACVPAPGSPAAQQQRLLAMYALAQWLPLLTDAELTLGAWDMSMDEALLAWLLPMARQLLALTKLEKELMASTELRAAAGAAAMAVSQTCPAAQTGAASCVRDAGSSGGAGGSAGGVAVTLSHAATLSPLLLCRTDTLDWLLQLIEDRGQAASEDGASIDGEGADTGDEEEEEEKEEEEEEDWGVGCAVQGPASRPAVQGEGRQHKDEHGPDQQVREQQQDQVEEEQEEEEEEEEERSPAATSARAARRTRLAQAGADTLEALAGGDINTFVGAVRRAAESSNGGVLTVERQQALWRIRPNLAALLAAPVLLDEWSQEQSGELVNLYWDVRRDAVRAARRAACGRGGDEQPGAAGPDAPAGGVSACGGGLASNGAVPEWKAPWAALLPSPGQAARFAASAGVAACASPSCMALEARSEVGLAMRRCRRCDAVAYCCGACQLAHWRAGHEEECAAMRGGVTKGTAAAAPGAGRVAEGRRCC